MAGRPADTPRFRYREVFPWLHLFRAFRIAADGRKLLLAGAALLLVSLGHWLFLMLPFAPTAAPDETPAARWPWNAGRTAQTGFVDGREMAARGDWLTESLSELLRPLEHLVAPAALLVDGQGGVGETALAWTQLLWALAVWSLFGAAITRLAAVEFAVDKRPSLVAGVRFAGERFLSYLSSPLLPVGFILAFWVLCFLGGLVGRVPWAGEGLVGALWFIPLALGLFMTVLLIGIAAGWPLMVSTISVEATDAYDGFSRSFSYIFSRPWHAVWFALVAVAYGLAAVVFVKLVASLAVYLAGWGVAAGLGLERLGPMLTIHTSELADPDRFARATSGWTDLGRPLAGFWLRVVALAVVAFASSYFWTAATIAYFLLRRSEDATDLDEVYVTSEPERDDLLPLVGVAASDQPIIERPPKPPVEQVAAGDEREEPPPGHASPPPEVDEERPDPRS